MFGVPDAIPRLVDPAAFDSNARALLIRVGADLTPFSGAWNGPCDLTTGEFAYVPILEANPVNPTLQTGYDDAARAAARFGRVLPARLLGRATHLALSSRRAPTAISEGEPSGGIIVNSRATSAEAGAAMLNGAPTPRLLDHDVVVA